MPKKGKFTESFMKEATGKDVEDAHTAPMRADPKPDKNSPAEGFKVRVDENNYRKHPDNNKRLIKRSLRENGAGRSIVVDNTGASIGGSGVLEQAEALGLKQRIVETDGSELVVVVRKDISPDDPRRKQLALADNATTDQSEWDVEALQRDWTDEELEGWGVDDISDRKKDDTYTDKIDGLTYEPTGENVYINELYDTGKYAELMAVIDRSDVPDDAKEMLRIAATRHIVFDYRKMAEYYAKASPEVQRLMEQSALVIVDFDSAIQNGFVVLQGKLNDQCAKDSEEAEHEG